MSRRTVLSIVAVVAGINALVWLIGELAPSTSGRPSSSLATTPRGFAAWAELARRNGVPVVALRDRLRSARIPAGATVIALDVPHLPRADGRALVRFAATGGHVVAGGRRPPATLTSGLTWRASGPRRATVAGRALTLAGRGSWSRGGVLVRRGGIELLADSSPLQNDRLAQADNAAFALDLAGRGPLVFAEAAHGYGDQTGLGALPGRAKAALVILLAAALALMLARGKRFGPIEPAARELPPPRVAFVDALATTLSRTGEPPPSAAELAQRRAEMMRP